MAGFPVMKLRVCDPTPVPGTVVHAVHDAPLNCVQRIEFAVSVLMTNSQTFVPSVAPNRPPPALNAWPDPNVGGVTEMAAQLLPAAL